MATYVARPLLQIGGEDASSDLMNDIQQISVEESLHLPAMFTLIIYNPYLPGNSEDEPWRYDDQLTIGQSIKIGFEASTTEDENFDEEKSDYIIEGEITAIESQFTKEAQAPVIVRGYDLSHRLHRGRFNRSFQNYTDTDIVQEIVNEVGIEIGQLDASGDPHDYVFQENQTNMEFLRQRAARIGFELYVQDNKLYFREPTSDKTLQLTWRKDFGTFKVRVSTAEQVSSVEVRGWDYTQKEAIVSTAESEDVLTQTEHGSGSETSSQFGSSSQPPKMIVVDQPVATPNEADAIAQALYNELGGEFVVADASGTGNPYIRAGRLIQLEDMGKYSGEYYITETRHFYYQRRYTTDFCVRGLRGGNLLSDLTSRLSLKPGQTFLAGIVTNNQDPDGLGRVRVRFPTLTPETDGSGHESNWARVLGLGAGDERGLFCLPEIDDEVLVGFEHGDIHRPYIIGSVWNGKDKTPDEVDDAVQKGKVRLRTVKTRTGHFLQFVEEDKDNSKAGVYLETAGGHQVAVNDSDQVVSITTNGGHILSLDDKKQRVEILTNGGHKLNLDDSNRSLTLQSSGSISIKAGTTISIEANGSISLQGATINLN
ncbi:MAG: VgrG-related protein [Spirulinaceae cyanobacterium RM2_2_10]|nr:VgrG-related protein [Spirulinaceae cyanobacterium SM2_1_0]NJO19475.1 VgrG-related protein [Spirulinaceae cyanobacterium RM2_2_10]